MVIKDGRFGAYVTDGETNATLRRGDEIETITAERAAELLAEKRAKGPAPKKRPAKKAAAKKAASNGRRPPRRPAKKTQPRRPPPAPAERLPASDRIGPSTSSGSGSTRAESAATCVARSSVSDCVGRGRIPAWPRASGTRARGARPRPVQPRPPTARWSRRRPPAQPARAPAPGQRFYDLPYSAAAPRLINPDLGLHNLVARAGHNAAYSIDVTLLDAPDHRLIRSGVLLAHRVLDGRGEWYLTAPDWQPLLPKDRIELMGHADLPEELADLLRPLRRRATLGPVAALTCDRREFALRDDHGTTLALLRDDKVTVRRGGLTTARYREVMITPWARASPTSRPRGWTGRSSRPAPRTCRCFPRLVRRLGAPATGPTDLPVPEPFDADVPFKKFVSQLLALRLRRIVEADLAIRGGDLAAIGRLADEAARLRDELKGLSAGARPRVGRGRLRRAGLDQPGLRAVRRRAGGTGWPAGCAASAT